MKVIYKYNIPIDGFSLVKMPARAIILSIGVQDNQIMLWAIVDTSEPTIEVPFSIVGTGNPLDISAETRQYIGTVQMKLGLVWHVFTSTGLEKI